MSIIVNTPTHTDVIKNKALLVRLARKKLSRNKMDKELGMLVTDMQNVNDDGAVRVNKSIFTKAATDAYMKTYNDSSKYFYRVTLPWDDRGYRLLSVAMYKEFTKKMKGFTSDYREQVNSFIAQIENHVEEAKTMLGDAFKAEDYKFLSGNGGIDTSWLEDQFNLEVSFSTVTDGNDLRAVLTEEDREAIAHDINKQALAKFARAQEHIVYGLLDCVKAIHERLCDSENVFRDSLIGNLEELCDLVPKMNIGGVQAISDLASDCKAALCAWDPQTLRDDHAKRDEVSKAADKILKQAEGLI